MTISDIRIWNDAWDTLVWIIVKHSNLFKHLKILKREGQEICLWNLYCFKFRFYMLDDMIHHH